jgi:ATP-dependent helicase/nuclease subunit A
MKNKGKEGERMGWTKEQEAAISRRGANLLVAAAAGSGKTAVLVERIVKMVCEENYDIDKILVVTFTKAAAAEMRERIGNRMLEEGMKHPDDQRIQEQLAYLHRAPISTIHSFCMDLLHNYFHLISLDPNFRIGEEGEIALLKEQVLEEMMEEWYQEQNEDFLRLIEAYSYGKDDRSVCDMILRLFDFSVSHPNPEQWLNDAKKAVETGLEGPKWLDQVMEYGDRVLTDALFYMEKIISLAQQEELLKEKYVPIFLADQVQIQRILYAKTYGKRLQECQSFSFGRLPAIRKKEKPILSLMESIKKLREEVKMMVNGLIQDCYQNSIEQLNQESAELKPYVDTLTDLVRQFSERFLSRKLENNMLEFNDLEHFSLKLLVEHYENGKMKKTALAKELSDYYQAVFTDEYQDSNLIQEVLLKAVSREEDGNRFMVGDIKQSIYKFRMARPELFLEKYETYGDEGLNQKIELRNNFRSRPEVLYSINYIFYQIMKPSLGDVLYDKESALAPPENGEEEAEETKNKQELLLVNLAGNESEYAEYEKNRKGRESGAPEQEEESYTAIELEAKMVAKRIKELLGEKKEASPHPNQGENPNQKAVWEYRDMVILLRTMAGWSQVFEEVLTMEGIPVHTESRTGYFDTFEIRVLLNLLSVVDNIYQDIPMAAVLRSPIGGFSGEDLAEIRSLVLAERRQEDTLYDEMIFYLEQGEKEKLKEKIRSVLKLLTELREEKTWLSLSELIWSAMEKTGYYHLVGSMENGEQRMANIRMFLEKARQYEKTSFQGVFHFLQYIEKLRSYQIDYGEASMLSEEANVVRIMSIHKSKGLEFPVVFLSGMGKQFNFMDRNQRMLLHPDYYLGLDCISLERRTKKVSGQKKMIGRQMVLSMLGEELRVLYVAMTRAKEKLIMTGVVKDFHAFLEKQGKYPEGQLRFYGMSKAKTYLDWVFPALCRNEALDVWKESHNIGEKEQEHYVVEGEKPNFLLKVIAPFQLFGGEVKKQLEERRQKEGLLHWMQEEKNAKRKAEIEKDFSWVYEKAAELSARSKWTVSELKEEWKNQSEIAKEPEELKKTKERRMPAFLQKKETVLTGASRGTAVHKLMEVLSFQQVEQLGFIQALDCIIEAGHYPGEYRDSLPLKRIEAFYTSDLGKRIAQAEREGNLYREAQFMMGVPMKEMEPETGSEELVLVQGVIDLYLEEADGLVLLDYKTDYIKKGGEAEFLSRYEGQLKWYKRALEQMTGKTVKEIILYSFFLGKAFHL